MVDLVGYGFGDMIELIHCHNNMRTYTPRRRVVTVYNARFANTRIRQIWGTRYKK